MIDTKALREKVLDLAIRGKLVPQDPNDEPASVLLERIRAEKEQMVKDGKLKAKDIKNDTIIFKGDDNLHYEQFPDGTVKCIEDEIPFELPEGWTWCRLKSITEIITKGASPKWQGVDYTTFGTLFITSENIGNDTLLLDTPKFLNDKINDIQPRSILKKHDVLTNIVGASIGRTCEYTLDTLSNINQAVAIIRMVDISFSQYIVKCLNSKYCINLMLDNQVDMARANLSLSSLSGFLIPLPPVKEQNRIVKQLKNIFMFVEKIDFSQKEITEIIASTKTKILDLAIRGKLVPQNPDDEPASVLLERIRAEKEELIKQGKIKRDKKESVIFKGEDNSYYRLTSDNKSYNANIPFEIPKSWQWTTIPSVASVELGKTLDKAKNTGLYHPYLRSVNIQWGYVDLSDLKEMKFEEYEIDKYSIKRNDLLICEGGDVGRCCIWERNDTFLYQNALHRVRFYADLEPRFYLYVMMLYESLGILKNISTGVTIKHLTGNVLSAMSVPLPPLAEQKRIVEAIETSFAQLNEILNSIS